MIDFNYSRTTKTRKRITSTTVRIKLSLSRFIRTVFEALGYPWLQLVAGPAV
jgi:hypothetical protein